MARRSGLGKGLSALIPTEVMGDRTSALREVPIGNIKPNPRQPRVNFDEETMSSLAASIKELGVLARAVVIVDGAGIVRYVQLVPEVSEEPVYDEAIAAAKEVAG